MYAVIMAGGQGTRLWPLSRKKLPKQLQKLTGEKSLLQETVDRLLPVIDKNNIIISTTPDYVPLIKKQLPDIPKSNYIIEPKTNGTAAACGLVSAILNKRDPKSASIFLPADHSIADVDSFRKVVSLAEKIIGEHPQNIITLGIEPTRPDVGLGYIERGETVDGDGKAEVCKVKRFVEKPSIEKAQEYLASGKYLWNAGIFVWKNSYIMDLFAKHMPKTYDVLDEIAKSFGGTRYEEVLVKNYGKTENTSIDYGIMEKTDSILVIRGKFGWSDIGNWSTLFEQLSKIHKTAVVSRGQHISHGDENCLILGGDKLIATLGLKDVVVIDTDDAILICNRHKAHQVKDLIAKLKDEGKESYL